MLNTERVRGQRTCTSCWRANRPTAKFCESCGVRLPDTLICGQCGEECVNGQRFCHECGTRLNAEGVSSTEAAEEGGRSGVFGEGAWASTSMQSKLRALRGRAATAYRESALARLLEPLEAPVRPGAGEVVEPGVERGTPDAGGTLTLEQVAHFGPAELVRANVLVGVLAVAGAVGGQWLIGSGQTLPAVVLFGLAIVLALWAFRRSTDFPLPEVGDHKQLGGVSSLWLLAVVLVPGATAAWSLERLLTNPDRPPDLFWQLHWLSVALLIGGVYLAQRVSRKQATGVLQGGGADHAPGFVSKQEQNSDGGKSRWGTGQRLLVLIIICIGMFMRVYLLPEFPAGTWYDEATAGLEAQRILSEPDYRPLYVSALMGPEHYVYLVSFLFMLLPKITFVVRFATVITGVLSVPAAYLAGSQLFGRGPALALALLIAVSRWSVNFSRIGMFNILMTLFVFLAIGLLFKALRRGRITDYLWAGLCLGFGLNTYYAFQLFLAVVSVFMLYLLISKRSLIFSQWKGLVVLGMGVLLFLAPLATFAFARLDRYLERTRTVSIFEEYPEDQVWGKVQENAVTHLLMYNVRGDPNGRHNLPGEPMLAPVAGGLLVLGLGLSLSRLWRPRFLLLVLWFFGLLAGGVFSLSFEAPQSLRAIGTLPVAYLLVLLPLALLWENWRAASFHGWSQGEEGATAVRERFGRVHSTGREVAGWFWGVFLWRGTPVVFAVVLLAAVGVYNFRTYFVRQVNDFAVWNAYSTGETIAATVVAEHVGSADTNVYLTSHYAGHPSVRFVGSTVPYFRAIKYTETLPMPLSSDRNALFLMDPERRNFFEQARNFYPNGEFIEHRPPFGGPTVLYEARLSPADITSIQGVEVSYFEGDAWAGDPVTVERHATVSVNWPGGAPVSGPFSAEWTGILNIEEYGAHKIVLRAPAAAELYIDEELVAQIGGGGEGEPAADSQETAAALKLALGLHRIRLRAVGGEGAVSLSWQRPGEEEQIVPSSALHVPPVASNGLLGRYYANGDWQGPPAFTRIDPQINLYFHDIPLPRPYTVEWEGKLAVPFDGVYRLGIESIDESELWIDDIAVAASPEPNQYDEDSITLTAGLHDIRIRYVARTSHYHVNLHWAPPGQERTLVQAEALIPPQGNYDHLAVEDLAIFDRTAEASLAGLPLNVSLLPVDAEQTAEFESLSDIFERPRGVAAANGMLYVVDPGQQSMFVLDPSGQEIAQVRRSNRRFSEPVDVAADAAGNVYVLDAGDGGQVSVHDAAGDFVRAVPLSDNIADRSRGIDVDGEGRIWLALTPALAVAAFDVEGRELARISTVFGEGDFQPVDVAYHADDAVFVSTVGTTAVVRFSIGGEPLNLWPLARANSADGPHMAVDEAGTLYVTQPELGGYLRIPPDDDENIGVWALPASQPVRKLVGVSIGPDGDLLLTDSENGYVYRVPVSP